MYSFVSKVAGLLAVFGSQLALAQAVFPTRPITILYPYAAGSGSDLAARLITSEAASVLGQAIVFENRPGANGRLGINAMRAAKPDGYTLAWGPDGVLVAQTLADPEFQLEPGRDYAPIALGFQTFLILAGHHSLPFRDLQGLIAFAKANPKKLNFGYTPGATPQFLIEMFQQAARIEVTMIPYKGGAQVATAALSGEIHLQFSGSTLKSVIDSGKMIPIAATTPGRQRWPLFPDVPSLTEAGVPISASLWFGVIAPAGTPPAVAASLNSAFNAVLKVRGVSRKLEEAGNVPNLNLSPEEYSAFIRSELDKWRPIVRKLAIKPG